MKYTLRDCNNSLLLEHDDIHNCLTKAIEQTIMFPLNLSARNGNEVKTILIDNQDEAKMLLAASKLNIVLNG